MTGGIRFQPTGPDLGAQLVSDLLPQRPRTRMIDA